MSSIKCKRGQVLTLDEKNVVLDVLEHFRQTMTKSKAVEACSEATGRSPRMIYKLAKEKEQGNIIPPKRCKRPHVKSHMRIMKYRSDVRSSIRRVVHSFFQQNTPPTLDTILEALNSFAQFPPFKKGTLYNLLRDIGFEYKRNSRKRRGVFVEKKEIITYRHKYLEKIKEARDKDKTIIYTGELWIDMSKIWKDIKKERDIKRVEDIKKEENIPQQKSHSESSPILVLVNAGFLHGFIEEAKLTLLCKTDKTDVCEELNSETYENWFFKKLLPNCPKNSVIVMDDAKYNSKIIQALPDYSWSKDDIIEWLENRGVEVDTTLIVNELLDLVNSIKDDEATFHIDSKCKQLGYEVLRLPRHHRELNPIYLVWDQVEEFIKNNSVRINDVLQLVDESYESVSSDDWLNYIIEVQANEQFLWQADCVQDNIDALIENMNLMPEPRKRRAIIIKQLQQ